MLLPNLNLRFFSKGDRGQERIYKEFEPYNWHDEVGDIDASQRKREIFYLKAAKREMQEDPKKVITKMGKGEKTGYLTFKDLQVLPEQTDAAEASTGAYSRKIEKYINGTYEEKSTLSSILYDFFEKQFGDKVDSKKEAFLSLHYLVSQGVNVDNLSKGKVVVINRGYLSVMDKNNNYIIENVPIRPPLGKDIAKKISKAKGSVVDETTDAVDDLQMEIAPEEAVESNLKRIEEQLAANNLTLASEKQTLLEEKRLPDFLQKDERPPFVLGTVGGDGMVGAYAKEKGKWAIGAKIIEEENRDAYNEYINLSEGMAEFLENDVNPNLNDSGYYDKGKLDKAHENMQKQGQFYGEIDRIDGMYPSTDLKERVISSSFDYYGEKLMDLDFMSKDEYSAVEGWRDESMKLTERADEIGRGAGKLDPAKQSFSLLAYNVRTDADFHKRERVEASASYLGWEKEVGNTLNEKGVAQKIERDILGSIDILQLGSKKLDVALEEIDRVGQILKKNRWFFEQFITMDTMGKVKQSVFGQAIKLSEQIDKAEKEGKTEWGGIKDAAERTRIKEGLGRYKDKEFIDGFNAVKHKRESVEAQRNK